MICEHLETVSNIPFYCLLLDQTSQQDRISDIDLFQTFPDEFRKKHLLWRFRAVSIDGLRQIKKSGIDVEPTDSPIYCDFLEKALEYGGWPKVIMGLDPKKLQNTFKEVPADLNPEEFEKLIKIYPTIEKSKDGTKLWLSRLQRDDPHRTKDYEIAYCRWIPGSPWDCLKVVLIVYLNKEDFSEIMEGARVRN